MTSQQQWEEMSASFEPWEARAVDQVIDVSEKVFLTTREQIVAYFRELNPGAKVLKSGKIIENWHRPLSEALQPYTQAKGGGPQKVDSIMRRFQARGGKTWEMIKVGKPQQAEYQALGLSLGWQSLNPPELGYHVTFDGYIRFSSCENKSFEVDITEAMADELAAHCERLIDIMMRVWMNEENDEEASTETCTAERDPDEGVSDPVITVTANSPDFKPTKHKRYKGKDLKKFGFLMDSYL